MARALSMCCLFVVLAACGDETTAPRDAAEDATIMDSDDTTTTTLTDALADVEVLFVGYPCDQDESCSTGFCYGKASLQGHFEEAQCQPSCLAPFDFDHYCNSDADCCRGTCCVGCGGAQNGLCTLTR